MNTTTQDIPLNQLHPSKRNVRKSATTPAQDEQLKASLAAHGVLQNLVVLPMAKKNCFEVVAGGRRLKLLKALVKEKRMAKDAPILCGLLPADASAEEISQAENIKADMDPIDTAIAFSEMANAGKTTEEIQAAFALTPREVKRATRLASIHPTILKAYKGEKLDYESLTAFTVEPDQKQQLAVFKSEAPHYRPWKIREAFEEHNIPGRDRRAKYVGREAYIEAGGQIDEDLFSDNAEARFLDAELLDSLFDEKLAKAAAGLQKREGWGDVYVHTDPLNWYQIPKGYKQRSPGKGKKKFTKEQAGKGKAAVWIDHQGKQHIERNMFKVSTKGTTTKKKAPASVEDVATDAGSFSAALKEELGVERQFALMKAVGTEELLSFMDFQMAVGVLSAVNEHTGSATFGDPQIAIGYMTRPLHRRCEDGPASEGDWLQAQMNGIDLTFVKHGYSREGWDAWLALESKEWKKITTLCARLQLRTALIDSDELDVLDYAFNECGGEFLHKFWRPTAANYFSRLTAGQLKAHLHEFYDDGRMDEEFAKAKKQALVDACDTFINSSSDAGLSPSELKRKFGWLPAGFVLEAKS